MLDMDQTVYMGAVRPTWDTGVAARALTSPARARTAETARISHAISALPMRTSGLDRRLVGTRNNCRLEFSHPIVAGRYQLLYSPVIHVNSKHDHEEVRELVARVVSDRDGVAFEDLIRRYSALLYGYVRGAISQKDDVDDVVQEVLTAAYLRLPELRKPERFGSWLLSIARSKVADYGRARQRHARGVAALEDEGTLTQPVRDDDASPARKAAGRELGEVLTVAVAELPEKYSLVLTLHLFEGRSPREIAVELGLREGTVRMRQLRGLRALRKKLQARGLGQ